LPSSPTNSLLTLSLTAYKLNCVEATAAALYITGYDQQADLLLSKFGWGHSFLEVNGQIIERYKTCTTPESVIEMQETIIKEMEAQDDEARQFDLSRYVSFAMEH